MTEQQIIKDVVDWYTETFPNVHPIEQVKKLVEEWDEYQNATTPEDKEEEAADVAIVVITILGLKTSLKPVDTHTNFIQLILNSICNSHTNILGSIERKMIINKQRAIDGRWNLKEYEKI